MKPQSLIICIGLGFILYACKDEFPLPEDSPYKPHPGTLADSTALMPPATVLGEEPTQINTSAGGGEPFYYGPVIISTKSAATGEILPNVEVYRGKRLNFTGTPHYGDFVYVGKTDANGKFRYYHLDTPLPTETVFMTSYPGYYSKVLGGFENYFVDHDTYEYQMRGVPELRFHVHYDTTVASQVILWHTGNSPYFTDLLHIPVVPVAAFDSVITIFPGVYNESYSFKWYVPAPAHFPPSDWPAAIINQGVPLATPGQVFDIEIGF